MKSTKRNETLQIYLLKNREDTAQFGETLGSQLRPGDVIGLIGDLGAGKTTLTQSLAQGMGIAESVTSPTFTLIQEYPNQIPLFHIDPYRLDRPEDVVDLGFEEYFERGGVVVVEWADKVATVLPPERLTLTLEILSAGTSEAEANTGENEPRRLTLQATGTRPEQLARLLAKSEMGRTLYQMQEVESK